MKIRDKWIKTQYSIKKWWFYRKKKLPKFTIVQIISFVVSLSTIASMLLVYFTLKEMQVERDNAYKPYLVIDNYWSEKVFEESLDNESEAYAQIEEATAQLHNIGVGTAKKIRFLTSDFAKIGLLQRETPSAFNFTRFKKILPFIKKVYRIILDLSASMSISSFPAFSHDSYILKEQNGKVTILLSEWLRYEAVSNMRHRIMKDDNDSDNSLTYEFAIMYEDMQGKEYMQFFEMKVEFTFQKDEQNKITGYQYTLSFINRD